MIFASVEVIFATLTPVNMMWPAIQSDFQVFFNFGCTTVPQTSKFIGFSFLLPGTITAFVFCEANVSFQEFSHCLTLFTAALPLFMSTSSDHSSDSRCQLICIYNCSSTSLDVQTQKTIIQDFLQCCLQHSFCQTLIAELVTD